MAAPATPTPTSRSPFTAWQGRFLVWFAGAVQSRLAQHRFRPDVALRNAAMRAAHRCGIDRGELVRATGLSSQTVTKALTGKPTPE
ncbi:hypothetical protein AB0B01_24125 [Streptomyces sp. NPDC044571]|uniref:hypothetical protein n=1 Tax=Streptomyces sp. NPDC044571 TaxID=3155371 RepID=UPI0033EC64B9